MNINRKSLEGLKAISEGLALFIAGLEESMNSISETTTTVEEKPVKKSSKKSAPIEEPDEEEEVTETSTEINEDVLNEMSYNDLKKLAKDYGISAVGNRKELVKKLLSLAETEDEDAENEEEEKPVKKSAPKSAKEKKPVEEEPDEEEEESDESDDEEDEDNSIAEQVNEVVAEMSDDELREILDSVSISSKGKRQALIAKIITAVEEGLVSLDDEETEEADEEEAEESEESADITEGMTKKRKKAFEELCDETNEQFENDEITRDDLIEFINDFNGTKDKMKKVSDEELITKYLELSAMMIDDEGVIVEEGAYYINEEPYCCGHPLTYDKKKKCYKCEHCGEVYDAE